MKLLKAVSAGFAGAVVLTLTHQVLHKLFKDAPRMDLMGEEALQKMADKSDVEIKPGRLYATTMAADIVANTIYYSLAGIGKPQPALLRGGLIGLLAGIGGVYLPKYLGLSNSYSNRTITTRFLTTAIYAAGGLVSGKVLQLLTKPQ